MLRASYGMFRSYVKLCIYYAFIYPYLSYCIVAWGCAPSIYLNKIKVLQKCAVCLIAGAHFLAHSRPIAHVLNILLVDDVYMFKSACLMFSVLHNSNLNTLSLSLQAVSAKVNYELCFNTNLIVNYAHTCNRHEAFANTGTHFWNLVPLNIRCICTFKCFKAALHIHLMNSYVAD